MMEEMSEEKKQKMTEMIREIGVEEEMIDEHLMHVVKKISFKLAKLRLILDEKGVEEAKVKEIVEKLVAKAMEKDLAKIKEWHKEHEDKECYHHEHKEEEEK